MSKLIGYRDLTPEQREEIASCLYYLACDLGLELYDFGGGNWFAPSVGKVNGETEALMFLFEKGETE